MPIIVASGRQALIDYTYQSSSKGWLDSNVMNHFWESVVSFFPLWVHPNLITFVGTAQFSAALWIFSTYCDDLSRCVSPWLYCMLAAALFVYQTMDAIDGKQARRTNQSSPLGQIFDHGNDAFIMTPITIATFSCLQFGAGWNFLCCLLMSHWIFFMVNFRARHVGVMHFGIFSVTETQFGSIAVLLITAIAGCEIWKMSVFGDAYALNLGVVSTVLLVLIGLSTICNDYLAVQHFYAENPGKNDPGQIYELLHMVLHTVAFLCWNLVGVFEEYTWTFLWIVAFVFCGLIHRLIVAEVTHMPSFRYYHLLNVYFVIIIGSVYEYISSVPKEQSIMLSPFMVYVVFAYVLLFWSAFVLKVIDEICDTLHIRLFVIQPKDLSLKSPKEMD